MVASTAASMAASSPAATQRLTLAVRAPPAPLRWTPVAHRKPRAGRYGPRLAVSASAGRSGSDAPRVVPPPPPPPPRAYKRVPGAEPQRITLLQRLGSAAKIAAAGVVLSFAAGGVAHAATAASPEAAPPPVATATTVAATDAAGVSATAGAPGGRVSATAAAADAAVAAEDPTSASALLRAKRSTFEAKEKLLKELRRLRGLNDDMAYTEFWELLQRKKVTKVDFSEDREALRAYFVNGESARVQLPFDPALMPRLIADKVPVDAGIVDKRRWAIQGVVRGLTPLIAFYGAIAIFKAAMKEPADEFMTPKAKQATADTGVTLDDVAGLGALRSEVEEIVRFLRNSAEFLGMGAQLPAGVLMVGPPGTGKTLLARAIAGEAQVPFYFAAGSEFMEMFVGVGAARVRALWQQARKTRPCIIFIDEFDAIGTARNSGGGAGGSEESANTINQLLTEMDGFEDNEGIVVLAATNRPAVLDKALTRPGRFDRWLRLPLPDLPGRVEILQVHARGKAVAADVDWVRVARACAGWSGADLENLMNQAAITCIRNDIDIIDTQGLFDAVDALRRDPQSGQLMLGISTVAEEEAIEELGPRTQQSIAIHAASKALMAHVLTGFDEVQKVHIFPGGEPTSNIYFLPREEALDTGLRTEAYMRSELVVRMAGRAGEAMLLGAANVSTFGQDDLFKAGYVARTLVLAMGVNQTLGPVSYMDSSSGEVYLSSDMLSESDRLMRMSPPVAFQAFAECAALIAESEAYASYTLALNWAALKDLVEALLERRVMSGPELARFLEERGVVQVHMGDFEGVVIDEKGNVHFPEDGTHGHMPAVQPYRITKAAAALPGDPDQMVDWGLGALSDEGFDAPGAAELYAGAVGALDGQGYDPEKDGFRLAP